MQKKETCQRKAQVHAIEPTAPTLGGRRPVVMPDPHSTIQEEEPESKPTFVKQVSTLSVFFYRVLFVNKSTLRSLTGTLWHQQCRPLSQSSTHLRCLVSEGIQTSTAAAAITFKHFQIKRAPRQRGFPSAHFCRQTIEQNPSQRLLPLSGGSWLPPPKNSHLLFQAIAEGGDSVYGLYGDLLNVRDYDCDSTELGRTCQEIHRSDPELDTIPYRVSTLDRRVTMKSQRPRSLDLSSWSVESRGSCHTTSSSDTSSEYASPSVSRNASFISNRSSFVGSIGPSSSVDLPPVPGGGVGGAGNGALRRRPSCRQQAVRANSKLAESATGQRTVTTLMGGRGYIQWRKGAMQTGVNNSDAYLVIWDHRL